MSIAKFLAAAATIAAPIGLVSAQSSAPADSGQHDRHVREWLAGTGAAAGAGVFLAFTHSGNNAESPTSPFSFHAPTATPIDPGPLPTGGSTPPASSPDTTSTAAQPDTTSTPAPADNPPPAVIADPTVTTPPDTTTVETPPKTETTPPQTDEPVIQTDAPPPPSSTDDPILPPDASTVPEPGSAALLATGIIGLAPLLRRRRK